MNIKISVIVPIYNVEEYLDECMESLLNQTFNLFEVIAIDDGSTDSSFEILKKYETRFKHIKIISKSNGGLSNTRNLGIEKSEGDYILFLDSDDMLRKDALEKLYNLAIKYKLDLVVYDGKRVDEINGVVDKEKYNRRKIYNEELLNKEEYFKGAGKKGMLHTPFHFYSKTIINKNKLRFEEGILHEDELFSITGYQFVEKVGYCKDQLYIRRYRSDSIMSSNIYKNKKSLNSYKYILSEFNKIKSNNRNNKDLVSLIDKRGTMLMCNLMRYENYNIKDLIKSKKEYNFNISIIRLVYNFMNYNVLIKLRGKNV